MNGRVILHLALFLPLHYNSISFHSVYRKTLGMKPVWLLFLFMMFSLFFAPLSLRAGNPLASFSPAWTNAMYAKANTGANARYLSAQEKEVLAILNMVRMNPPLFANTVLKKFPNRSFEMDIAQSAEFNSLMQALLRMKPLPLLQPDSLCWVSARCHAQSTGKAGYVGHDRISEACNQLMHYSGESCHYGYTEPVDMITSLLIDKGVPSLGHRNMLLGSYSKLGPAIAPHATYNTTLVLNFY